MGWLGVYLFWLMDILGFKSVSSKGFRKVAIPQHPEYVVYVAAREFMDSGVMERAKTLLEFMKEKPPYAAGVF